MVQVLGEGKNRENCSTTCILGSQVDALHHIGLARWSRSAGYRHDPIPPAVFTSPARTESDDFHASGAGPTYLNMERTTVPFAADARVAGSGDVRVGPSRGTLIARAVP